VRHAFEGAAAALDRVVDAVLGHVGLAGLVDREAQARIAVGITPTELGGDGDLLDKPGEDLALLSIRGRLAVLDVRPFAVTCHGANSKGNISRHAPTALAGRQERQEGARASAGSREPPRP